MASGRPASLTALLRSRCGLFKKLPEVSIILFLLILYGCSTFWRWIPVHAHVYAWGLDPVAMLFLHDDLNLCSIQVSSLLFVEYVDCGSV